MKRVDAITGPRQPCTSYVFVRTLLENRIRTMFVFVYNRKKGGNDGRRRQRCMLNWS